MTKEIMKTLQWIDRYHWLWLLLSMPLLIFPGSWRMLGLIIVPGLWVLRWIVGRKGPQKTAWFPVTPLNGSLYLLVLMVLVSVWATYDLALSLPRISGMVLGLGVYFAMMRVGRSTSGWWVCLAVFGLTGLGIATLGLLGTNWFGSKLVVLNKITAQLPNVIKMAGLGEGSFHPNQVAGALSWVLPLGLALSVGVLQPEILRQPAAKAQNDKGRRRLGWRLALWLGTLFMAGVVVLTQSRSVYLGLTVTLFLMFIMALSGRWRWAGVGLLIIGGLVLGGALARLDLAAMQDWLVGSGLTSENALSLNSFEGRLELWSRAFYGLQDFPFTGMGMNTFQEIVHVLYPLFLVAPDVDIGHAHNEFLQAGLDLGIPGMVAFISLNLGAFWMLGRVWRNWNADFGMLNSETRVDWQYRRTGKMLVLGLGGGLLAHLLYGLANAAPLGAKVGILFWMLLALIASLHEISFAGMQRNNREL